MPNSNKISFTKTILISIISFHCITSTSQTKKAQKINLEQELIDLSEQSKRYSDNNSPKVFTGKIDYIIYYRNDLFFTINDPINGRADIYLKNGNCSKKRNKIKKPDGTEFLIKILESGEQIGDIVLQVQVIASTGYRCIGSEIFSFPIWIAEEIKQIPDSDIYKRKRFLDELPILPKIIDVGEGEGEDKSVEEEEQEWETLFFDYGPPSVTPVQLTEFNVTNYNINRGDWKNIYTFQSYDTSNLWYAKKNELEILEIEKEINNLFQTDQNNSKKDPFETTIEFSNRLNTFQKKIRRYEETNLIPLLLKRNKYKLIYEREKLIELPILLKKEDYNADNQIWKISISNDYRSENIEISIPPLKAKQLWETKESWQIYKVKKIITDNKEYIELVIPKQNENKEFSILLSKNFSSEEKPIDNRFNDNKSNQESYDRVFSKVEIDAEFPGGASGWTRYITREIERNIDELQDDGQSGTVIVLFIVDKEGGVSEVRALSCAEAGVGNCLPPSSKLAVIAVNAVQKGPNWKPAVQNGRNVKAYRRQPVTFSLAEK